MAKTYRARKILRIFVCGFSLLFFYGLAAGQYRFDTWTTDDGLPQNSVNGIEQSDDGYIWGVTTGGIFRFDGVRFKVFNKSNTKELKQSRFIQVKKDGEGRLWFLSDTFRLVKYEKGEFTTYEDIYGAANRIKGSFLFLDANGRLIFTIDPGHFRYENGQFVKFDILSDTPGSYIVYSDKFGGIWLKDDESLRRVVGEQVEYFDVGKLYPGFSPIIYDDRFGNFWIRILPQIFYRKRRGKMQRYKSDGSFVTFAEDREGNLWLGEEDGLIKVNAADVDAETIDISKAQKFTKENGLLDDQIGDIFVDRNGGIWTGGAQGGLAYLTPQVFRVFSKKDWGTKDENVYPIFEDSKQNVWVGIWHENIVKFDKNNDFKVFNFPLLLLSPTSIYEDTDGRIWFGEVAGVRYFEGERLRELDDVLGKTGFTVLAITEDDEGNMLFGTETGLLRYKNKEFIKLTTQDGLPDNFITAFQKTPHGKIWIGTRGGLAIYDKGKFTAFTVQDDLDKDHVRSLYLDSENVLWIGTYDTGLIRYKDGKFKRIGEADGMFNGNVFCTLEDDNGWFWINSNNGIYRIKKSELNDFADGKIKRVESVGYNKKDGLLNIEGNGGKQPAGIKRSNGELWFPTQHGAAVVKPNELTINSQPPTVHIEEILIDSENIGKYNGEIKFEAGQENLEINYTGLSFASASLVKFRYRLEGLEEDWNEAETRRTAFYNNIPPGEYTFQVIAANRDGVWNMEGKKLKIIKLPHYYETWWFLIFSILAAVGLVSLIVYKRFSYLKNIAVAKSEYSRKLIASQEAERKHLAAELHDGLGQDLIVIKNRVYLAQKNSKDQVRLKKELENISETTSHTLQQVREITDGLRPMLLDKVGLTKALKIMLEKVSGVVEIESNIDPIDDLFSETDEINIYRIVQESVNNIIKHSNAANAFVEVERTRTHVLITIKDNGVGFNTEKVKSSNGSSLGLIGLKERARSLDGTFSINSVKGKGTTVKISIDLSK
ncbi:MAG: hypothetical protein KIS76_00160 [Pyrinomonadaceae bacterium]|nr:hypothetical protein [Pyrinomonadaceae bacterium]